VAEQFIVVRYHLAGAGWVTTPSSNYGIALNSTAGNLVFDSKENDETSHVAHLDITVVSQDRLSGRRQRYERHQRH